ncbi:murein transglycosylase A, partial [Alphaproteobacteria bacterium]|nr:murein transglycosylase A [Alphaproteobacteria bacterium]
HVIQGPEIQIGLWLKQESPISRFYQILLFAAFLSATSGCALVPERATKISLELVNFSSLEGWSNDRLSDALVAHRKSCVVLLRAPQSDGILRRLVDGRAINWRPACKAASAIDVKDDKAARGYFEKWFHPYAVFDSNGKRDGLLTGYYEPELRGARQPSARYNVPIYGRPADLVTAYLGRFDAALAGHSVTGRVVNGMLVPYPDRKSIDGGNLSLRPEPLVWVDSKIDAFFLHIQGSGRIKLAGGGMMRLGFAASNGRAYTAIGRTLVGRGAIPRDRVSMQTIRAWLTTNPDKARGVMAKNARYIFFHKLTGNAPVGAQGVELTAERSLAVDRRAVPLGALLWLETKDPIDSHKPYQRLMVAQDVGHAIKGSIRGDIYFGHGRLAARRAGLMKQYGRYYILLPTAVSPVL